MREAMLNHFEVNRRLISMFTREHGGGAEGRRSDEIEGNDRGVIERENDEFSPKSADFDPERFVIDFKHRDELRDRFKILPPSFLSETIINQ